MQLHLPYFFLGLLPICVCSFQFFIFFAAAVLEIFRSSRGEGKEPRQVDDWPPKSSSSQLRLDSRIGHTIYHTHKDLTITILFKIITRMKLLFSNYLGCYSYSFQGSSEIITITVTVSLFFSQNALQEIIPFRNFPEILAITVTWFNGFRITNVMISKRMVA